jgi:AraC-like DNA-binding protein
MRHRHDETFVVVIAPAAWQVVVDRPRGARSRMLRFETLDELDRWRSAGPATQANTTTIRTELVEALRLAGADAALLSHPLRAVIEKAVHRHTIPRVKELQRFSSSPRAFFRLWAREIPERPSQVLLRARVLLAAQLIEEHVAVVKACRKAGFRSVPQFIRHAGLGGSRCVHIAAVCTRKHGMSDVAGD